MRTRFRAVPMVAGLAVPPAGGVSGAPADGLRDLREVTVTVADIGRCGQACGLTEEALERAFFMPMRLASLMAQAFGEFGSWG